MLWPQKYKRPCPNAKKTGQSKSSTLARIAAENLTEGNQGNEATGVGLGQISTQALLLPLMTEIPTALCYLRFLL
jgi:hypothetical protein